MKVLPDAVKCQRCNSAYPIERGFPMMLLDQEMVAILAGMNNFKFGSWTNEVFFSVRGIDHVKRSRSRPSFT